MHDDRGSASRARRAVRLWLLAAAAMILLTLIVGGATRLTESGLSIVEWKPVTGVLPPLSERAWQAEFDKYKAIPQYRELNHGMSLAQFKVIYWWEWTHRLLARVDRRGVPAAVPVVPVARLRSRRRCAPRLWLDFRGRRAARRGRLVDGVVGPHRPRSRSRNTGWRSILTLACAIYRRDAVDRAADRPTAAGAAPTRLRLGALALARHCCWCRSISARWWPGSRAA